jgi:DNA-binding transcriptional ArsR family regulator
MDRRKPASNALAGAAELSRFLTALGDPTRQEIVLILSREALNVNELTARFALSRPAVSHQLKVLTDAGVVVRERRGRERVYRVDAARCRAFADQLKEFVQHCCAGRQCC